MTHFRITSQENNRLVLDREGYGWNNIMPAVIGFLLAPAGVAIMVFAMEPPYLFLGFSIAMMGFMTLYFGTVLLPDLRRRTPRSIIFNHETRNMEVWMSKGIKADSIPYSVIKGFYARNQKEGYLVSMIKKDGGEWQLISTSSFKRATDSFNTLKAAVSLHAGERVPQMPIALPSHLNEHRSDKGVLLCWQNKLSLAFYFLLMFFFFFTVTTIQAMNGLGQMVMAIPLIMVSIGIAILIRMLYVRSGRRIALSINSQELAYYEFSKKSGVQRKKKCIPIHEIERVVYSYAPSGRTTNMFKIQTTKNIERQKAVENGDNMSFADLLNKENWPLNLTINSITPVDAISIERWIECELNRSREAAVV